MAGDIAPYSSRRSRQSRKAQLTVLAEDIESNLQEDLHQYWRTIRKRIGLVLAIPAALLALTILRDEMATPLYTATATILIRNTPPSMLENATVTIVSQNSDSDSDQDETQLQLLKSKTLAARVVAAEGLRNDPAFLGRRQTGLLATVRDQLKQLLFGRPPRVVTPGEHPEASSLDTEASTLPSDSPSRLPDESPAGAAPPPRGALVSAYLSKLQISPVPNTQMVKISFTTADPRLSARLANAHAREFIAWGVEMNSHESEEAEDFLKGKLQQIREQLEASEAAVNQYRRDKGIVPGLISVNGKEDVILERLNKMSEELQAAHLQTISLATQVMMIKKGRADALPEVIGSGLVQRLTEQLDSDEAQYAGLSGKFKPDYPPMRQLALRIAGTRSVLEREISSAVASVEAQYAGAQEREANLQNDLNQQKALAFGLNDAAVRYLILERDADTNRELYNAVLKRMKDLTVVADVHASNVLIVDEAEAPGGPSSPELFRDAIAAAVLGLVLGVALALLIDLLDNTFQDSREVERYLRVPSLALIPEAVKTRESLYISGNDAPDTTSVEGPSRLRALVTYQGGYSILGEAYRNLRTGLMLSRAGSQPRITLITSAVPEEGKTTVSVNTAIVLAHAGGRVLLIEADLRIPRCHKVLGATNLRGLTEVLTGLATPENCISPTAIDNLFIMTAGQLPPNPSELFSSPQMSRLLDQLRTEFTHIIIDSPPALPVSDAILLSVLADGVLVVVAGNKTPKQQVKAVLARLRHAHAKIFGIVLNRIKIHKVDYFFPYYKYYGPAESDEQDGNSAPDNVAEN